MITYDQYVQAYKDSPDLTKEIKNNINNKLLPFVNNLLKIIQKAGLIFLLNPLTNSYISGNKNGGFRIRDSKVGAFRSKHKDGTAIDIYDYKDHKYLYLFSNPKVLEEIGIWIEIPASTHGWSHWQVIAPKSGNRFFIP